MSAPQVTVLPTNYLGVPTIPGPYVPSTGNCAWCRQTCTLKDDGFWVSGTTRSVLCTPEDRGAKCALAYYWQVGIDPLKLLNHDGLCRCQTSLMHNATATSAYPHPERVPFHCDQPMQLSSTGWRCRNRRCVQTYDLGTVIEAAA